MRNPKTNTRLPSEEKADWLRRLLKRMRPVVMAGLAGDREIWTPTSHDLQRFWKSVQKGKPDECWPWTASTTNSGYGQFTVCRIFVLAHRFSYYLANGSLTPGLLVMHKCDNPGCVNPAHLSLGTVKDNHYDAVSKGRTPNRVYLIRDKLPEIKTLLTQGKTQKEIAVLYNTTELTIYKVLKDADCSTRTLRRKHPLPRKENPNSARLTANDVRQIRALRLKGISHIEIAHRFNISASNSCHICLRDTWDHIP